MVHHDVKFRSLYFTKRDITPGYRRQKGNFKFDRLTTKL